MNNWKKKIVLSTLLYCGIFSCLKLNVNAQEKNSFQEVNFEQRLNKLEDKMDSLIEELKQIKVFYQDSTLGNKNDSMGEQNESEEEVFNKNFFENQDQQYGNYNGTMFGEQSVAGNVHDDESDQDGKYGGKNFSIERIYSESMQQFRLGNYEQSEVLLEKIIQFDSKKDDNSSLITENFNEIKANSYFLLAEIYFKKPDYQKSAINFLHAYQSFVKINAGHLQAGNSLLRLSKALYLGGNQSAACQSLLKLSSDFTSIDYSLHQISEAELGKLQCKKN